MFDYDATPGSSGGFTPVRSGSAGYVNLSQGIPFYSGRSQLATTPEFQRNPGLLEKDVLMTIKEKGSNLAKILLQYAERNGIMEKDDVRYFWRTEVEPHPRFYLKTGVSFTVSGGQTTFTLSDFTRPTQSYPIAGSGNPKVTGNIGRLQAGDFALLMCAWLASDRSGSTVYKNGTTEGYATPVPEIFRVVSVDVSTNTFVAERNWAGAQRAAAGTAPGTFAVVADSTAAPSSSQVRARDAFFMLMPRSMKEDNIDAKVHGMTGSWDYGIMKRTLKAWGSGYMGEVIRKNLGLGSKLEQDKTLAMKEYYNALALDALWGEKSETWDAETGEWSGTTDGLLATIDSGHYIGIVPMNYGLFRSTPQYAYGTFDIPVFNKFLENKGYHSEGYMIAVCGSEGGTAFATMINQMTQNIPDIKGEWHVEGKRYRTNGGLTVDFVQEDAMTLNGFNNKMLLIDPAKFKMVKLRNYPTDIVEVKNENPLLANGFMHGVYSFINTDPDAHWVCTIDKALASGITGATYATNVLGVAQS